LLTLWILFSKNLKMIPHFRKRPQDMKFIPTLIWFSYYHGILNCKALYNLQNVSWSGKDLTAPEQRPAVAENTTLPTEVSKLKNEKDATSYVTPPKTPTKTD
jgi:hypothetical protein